MTQLFCVDKNIAYLENSKLLKIATNMKKSNLNYTNTELLFSILAIIS